jgi:hypothetical protein
VVPPERLHFDDGSSELDHSVIFDWRSIYGTEASFAEPAV